MGAFLRFQCDEPRCTRAAGYHLLHTAEDAGAAIRGLSRDGWTFRPLPRTNRVEVRCPEHPLHKEESGGRSA